MNIIKNISLNYPLNMMYVPSGWMVSKNNLVDIGLEFLNDPNYTDDLFLIKENFFSSNILYLFNECFIRDVYFKCVIDVGCLLFFLDGNNSFYNDLEYEINLSLYRGKSKKEIYDFNLKVKNRYEMIKEVNFLMSFFSSIVIDAIESNGINVNLDNCMKELRK